MKIFHGIADDDESSRGGDKKFTGGGGNRSSRDPQIDSTGNLSSGLFSDRGASVYSLPAERVKGNVSLTERLSLDDHWTRIMRINLNLVSRVGSDVYIAAQDAIVLLFLEFTVYVGAMGGIKYSLERFFMDDEINPMGAEAIRKEGMSGTVMAEEWFRASTPVSGEYVLL